MSGFMGDLSEAQQQLLDAITASEQHAHTANQERLTKLDKARITKKEGREASADELAALRKEREDEWPYELLRFLRANKWDLAKSQEGYRAYMAWRLEHGADSILDDYPWNAELIDRIVGNNAAGEDKEGRPVYIEKSGGCDVDALLSLFTDEDIIRSHLWQQENSVRRALEQSKKHGRHIETFTQIVDLNHLSMAHQRALKFTKEFFSMDAKYYPERLGHLYVVNAPWVFPVIWNIVKGWIDPVTRNKIHVIKGDPSSFLLQHFDADQLPKEYGGTCGTCPNSPDCCKQYPLSEALELLPFDSSSNGPIVGETIKAGKNFNVKHQLLEGEVVEWFWTLPVEKDDIDFSVQFVPDNKESKTIDVVRQCRIVSTGIPAQSSFQVPSNGTVTIMWDNNFSYFSSKNIEYWTRKAAQRTEASVKRFKEKQASSSSSSSSAIGSSSVPAQ